MTPPYGDPVHAVERPRQTSGDTGDEPDQHRDGERPTVRQRHVPRRPDARRRDGDAAIALQSGLRAAAIVMPNSPIKTIADLKGKTVGIVGDDGTDPGGEVGDHTAEDAQVRHGDVHRAGEVVAGLVDGELGVGVVVASEVSELEPLRGADAAGNGVRHDWHAIAGCGVSVPQCWQSIGIEPGIRGHYAFKARPEDRSRRAVAAPKGSAATASGRDNGS